MKIKKRTFWITLILVFGFVLADYLELFPTIYKDMSVNLPFTFEFIDSVNGTHIDEVIVNAAYKGSDVIGKYHDEGGGIVYVVIQGGGFGYKQSFFFKKPSPRQTIKRINEKKIDFTFQHPRYKTLKKTLSRGKSGEIYTMKLDPVKKQSAQSIQGDLE